MRVALVTLLLILLGIALLYAYRAQRPARTSVTFWQAVTEIQGGQVSLARATVRR